MKVTEVQMKVLHRMKAGQTLTHPRSSLERLQKKGLVNGSRKAGWVITLDGLHLLETHHE